MSYNNPHFPPKFKAFFILFQEETYSKGHDSCIPTWIYTQRRLHYTHFDWCASLTDECLLRRASPPLSTQKASSADGVPTCMNDSWTRPHPSSPFIPIKLFSSSSGIRSGSWRRTTRAATGRR